MVAPTFLRAEPIDAEGYAYHVYFGRASGGLRANGALKGFDAIGEKWEPLDVLCEIVSPDCVRVTASAPIYRLRYAPETASVFGTDATLCNAAGIPACAFSVDLKEFPVSISAVLHTCAVRIFQVIWRYRVLFWRFRACGGRRANLYLPSGREKINYRNRFDIIKERNLYEDHCI